MYQAFVLRACMIFFAYVFHILPPTKTNNISIIITIIAAFINKKRPDSRRNQALQTIFFIAADGQKYSFYSPIILCSKS